MTQQEFIALDVGCRGNVVFLHGKFLESRKQGQIIISLYRLDEFYVDVHYNVIENRIEALNPVGKEEMHKGNLIDVGIDIRLN